MTESKKPVSVIFAPGCFDTFEGTQEELDELMADIQETFTNMTPEELAAQSISLDELVSEIGDWEIVNTDDEPFVGRGKYLQ